MVLRVMTWNVENLFGPGGTYGPADEDTYQAKLSALAAVINDHQPHIAAMQEIGGRQALAHLVDLLDGTWHIVVSQHPDSRRVRVGFISRHTMQPVVDRADFPDELAPLQASDTGSVTTRMGRGALAVRIQPDSGRPVALVTCHLKSKLLTFPRPGFRRFTPRDEGERARYSAYALYRRAAEAVTVRHLVDQLLDGDGHHNGVIVAGDLNDETQAATTQILHGPPGSELGTHGAARPDQGDAHRMWNLAPLISQNKRWSRIYRGRHELIDHIMVSHALHQQAEPVYTVGERDLVSIYDNPEQRRTARDSDHAPVIADLHL